MVYLGQGPWFLTLEPDPRRHDRHELNTDLVGSSKVLIPRDSLYRGRHTPDDVERTDLRTHRKGRRQEGQRVKLGIHLISLLEFNGQRLELTPKGLLTTTLYPS